MTTTQAVTLKLRGKRLIEAAEWMMGKPTPEDVDPEQSEWSDLGAAVINGVLSVPTHLLTTFIEECEDGVEINDEMTDDPYEGADARAMVRSLRTIIERLDGLR